MKVDLLLVRHGESVRNLSCDQARAGDPTELARQMREELEEATWPLTEKGFEQARRAGAWIREEYGTDFQAAVTSPFLRACQSAEALGLGLQWREDERLREREWGDYCAAGFEPYTVDAYLRDLAECSRFTWRSPFPGAESLADMVPRVRDFLHDLFTTFPGGRAIVVSHGGTMRAMQLVLERVPVDEHHRLRPSRMTNANVIVFRLNVCETDRTVWSGETRQVHPAFPAVPSTDWQPLLEA